MPSISKIRFTNIIYDNKQKRFNDDIFTFDGHNAAVLLENGGGKTVFIQCAIQAVLPHADLGDRKIKETLLLDNNCAHIAIEWILKDRPRKYCVTAVSLYKEGGGSVTSYRFINEYGTESTDSIEHIPFALEATKGRKRPASREEIGEYYAKAKADSMTARTFNTIHEYQNALSKDYGIIASEWRSQLAINKKEGGVEEFFDGCATTGHLVDNLLIPSIEAVIAGDGTKGFAKTFENQRDTFKEYNRLTRLIAESDMAAERLNTYVKECERLDKRQREVLSIQKQAKALKEFAAVELKGLDERCGELATQKEALNKERSILVYKRESILVQDSHHELLAAEKELSIANEVYEKRKEVYNEKAGRKESIELHRANHEIGEWKAKIRTVQEEIERIEKDTDIEELRDEYDDYASRLRGYYAGIEENIRTKMEDIKAQYKKRLKEKEALTNDQEAENKKLNGLFGKKAKLVGKCASNDESITRFKRKILVDIKNERVEDVLNGYNKRLTEIENIKSSLDAEINGMDKRAAEIKAELPSVQDKQYQINRELTKLTTELKGIDEQIRKIASRLSEGYKEFYNLKPSNFYHKEKTVTENFTALIYKVNKAKEETLLNERLKKRLSDAYDGNRYFTGAPELHDIIEEMRYRFSFIQAGSQYIHQAAEALNMAKEKILARFPFWQYAVIINETDVGKLKQEFGKRELSTPVLIVTLAKAREFVDSVSFDIDSVIPDFWISNLDKEFFQKWKEEIKEQGAAAEEDRHKAEKKLARIQADANEAANFFDAFPHENYEQMNAERGELERHLSAVTERTNALEKELDGIRNGRNAAVNQKNHLERETDYIHKNREYAQIILKMQEENIRCSRDIAQIEDQIAETEEKARALKRKIEDAALQIEQENRNLNESSIQLKILQNEEWYKNILDRTPDMRSSMPKNALIEKLEYLKQALRKVDENHGTLIERMESYRIHLKKAEENFKKLKKAAQYPWTDQEGYHEGLEVEYTGLEEQLPTLLREMKNKENVAHKLKEIQIGKKALYEDCLKKFKDKYDELYVFQQSIQEARESLREEEISMAEKAKLLEQRTLIEEREKKKAEQAFSKLKEMEWKFQFEHVNAESGEFADTLNYAYNRLKIVEHLDTGLQQAFSRMNEEYKTVNNAKRAYCERCRNEMSDIRNRDKLIDIVEKADNFQKLVESQKAMNASLERAKTMARSALAEREEKMFQFTNHLYTHVEKIAKELLLIPKKTRIRIGSEWKEIYDIQIAEWNEKEARMAIRSQINYILDRIENNPDYKTDEGIEDITKIKAFIEKSLKTKQLLKRILGSNEIRVRCRKVTNDNQVSHRFFSWEESEKWSGGERWSKNMALFLGVQNYIAEKTEPDLKAGKSNSCVLLDNPFGKASSEHVLNPVFFIAKELGFQIITVTAHAEGKFISDYFPVVYSLKLREAPGGKTSVMTKEFIVKHAYFEDRESNSPLSVL